MIVALPTCLKLLSKGLIVIHHHIYDHAVTQLSSTSQHRCFQYNYVTPLLNPILTFWAVHPLGIYPIIQIFQDKNLFWNKPIQFSSLSDFVTPFYDIKAQLQTPFRSTDPTASPCDVVD